MRATIYSPMSVAGSNLNMLIKTRGGNVSAAMRQIDTDLSAAAPGVAEQIMTAQDLVVMMDTFDVVAFSAGIVIVIAACLVAAFYPARRAAGVEPWVALRIE